MQKQTNEKEKLIQYLVYVLGCKGEALGPDHFSQPWSMFECGL